MKRNAIRSKLLQMIIAFILIAALVGVYFTVLGASAVRTDEQLKAERATYAILNYEKMKELARIERESEISDLFHKDEEEDISKAVLSYNIKGLDEAEDYILVTGAGNGGYAIYAKDNLELLEFSPFCESPYKTVEKDKAYYGGPMSYYEKKNEVLKNIDTGEAVTVEEANEIAASLKDVQQAIKQERVAEKQTEAEEVSQIGKESLSTQHADTGATSDDTIDLVKRSVQVISQKLISDYKYFMLNPYHHNNNDPNHGTCVPVAMQLLLGYNNWSKDGRLITNNEYLEGRDIDNNGELNNPYSYDSISTTEKYFDLLHTILGEHLLGDLHIDADRAFGNYLKDYVEPDVSQHITHGYNYLTVHELVNEINADRPVMASIRTGVLEYHMIIVYGMQTIRMNGNNIEGYISHFGWQGNKYYAWVNKSFYNGYLYFRVNHSHTDEVLESDSHVVKCIDCNRIKYNNRHIYSEKYETFNINLHNAWCKCGEMTVLAHRKEYTPLNNIKHTITCTLCELNESENHFFKQDRPYCFLCDYVKGA